MQQFSNVLKELNKWYQSFKWYPLLHSLELKLLFGGLGIVFIRELLYTILPYQAYRAMNVIFYTIPLNSLGYHAFLLGAWLTLASKNVRYLPYALWGYAFYIMFPFTSISLSTIISTAVYALLGYGVFRYSASPYVDENR
ncbi:MULTISPECIES: hypothetical protein [Paenibacillus]|uniref:hypothetical protein n=1 Tax=Paenibacillus TaxID=44249 RepID=UPI0020426301|nr:hypothetical protein [Paenibacillus camelliae]MCM3634532.1 hypothetical protein [Paenibacillus camelliae]